MDSRRRRRGTASASTRGRSSHASSRSRPRSSVAPTSSTPRSCGGRPSGAEEIGWEIEPSRAQFLPDSVASWLPFRETNAAMDRLAKRYDVGIVSNIDDKLLGVSRRHLRTDLELVVTAQQVRSYKPDPAHFKECARRIGGKKGWVHIASGYETDIAPVLKMNVPGDLGEPQGREAQRAQAANRDGQELPRGGQETWRRLTSVRAMPPMRRWWQERTSGSPPSGAGRTATRPEAPAGKTPQPGRDRRAEVRHDQPSPLPEPAPGGRRCRGRRSSTSSSPS